MLDWFQRGLRRASALAAQLDIFAHNQWRHHVGGSDWLQPAYAIYELTRACNLDCSYCDDGAGHSYPRRVAAARPLALEDARRMLERLRRDVPAIYVTGGEPTVHPHFLALVREIDRLGFSPVILNTNGLRIPALLERDPELLDRIDVLVFSLDALDARVLDRLFQSRPGDGRRTLDTFELCLDRARDAGCTVAVNCVVTRATIADARAVAALCKQRRIPFLPVPANRGKGLIAPLSCVPEFRALADEVTGEHGPPALGPREVVSTLMRFEPFECHPALRLHVTPDGKVPWPCQSDQRFALSILDYASIPELMRAAEARFSVEGYGKRCGSPCYLAQNVSTDWYFRRPSLMFTNAVGEFFVRGGRTRARVRSTLAEQEA